MLSPEKRLSYDPDTIHKYVAAMRAMNVRWKIKPVMSIVIVAASYAMNMPSLYHDPSRINVNPRSGCL